jgi:hypothetical protein
MFMCHTHVFTNYVYLFEALLRRIKSFYLLLYWVMLMTIVFTSVT